MRNICTSSQIVRRLKTQSLGQGNLTEFISRSSFSRSHGTEKPRNILFPNKSIFRMENQGAVAYILLFEYKPLRKLDIYALFLWFYPILGHLSVLCLGFMLKKKYESYAEHFFSMTNSLILWLFVTSSRKKIMAAVNLPFLEGRPEIVHIPAPMDPPAGPGVANGG